MTAEEQNLRAVAARFADERGFEHTVMDTLEGVKVEFIGAPEPGTGRRPFMVSTVGWLEVHTLRGDRLQRLTAAWAKAWAVRNRWEKG